MVSRVIVIVVYCVVCHFGCVSVGVFCLVVGFCGVVVVVNSVVCEFLWLGCWFCGCMVNVDFGVVGCI